jgi:hypothetical protein
MTIKYPNGAVCKAIMLSYDQDEIRLSPPVPMKLRY